MKRKTIGALLASGMLALALTGCAAGEASSTANESASSATDAQETSAADAREASATDAQETSAADANQTSTLNEAPSSTMSEQGPEGKMEGMRPGKGGMGPGGDGGMGPGKGGMGPGGDGGMGGAMDTQPGQTTEKGFTANDNGIAISATLNVADAFTERDLEQTANTASATTVTLETGKDITITEEGVYVVSGTATDATIIVEAADTAKVQLVLDGVSITNTDFPAIYIKSADKVFVTLQGENTLKVTGEFIADGETETDAVIFSKDDLCLNGNGSLTIDSTEHGIVSKDDLKVTGGTYTITAANGSGLRANDSVRIANGTFTINAEDGIKAKNSDDNEQGYVYIKDGMFTIKTTDNGIQGYAFVWIDGGTFDITSEECLEGTYIQINDGKLTLNSSDDAINASIKSSIYTPTIEINGGTLDITMAQGDTDALDSNGYLYIKGGTVNISAQFPFDYAWGAEMTGGEVTVNGEKVTEITDSMMGGPGGMNGEMPGGPGGMNGEMPGGGPMDGQTPPEDKAR